jgi:hypothetical protein
MGTGVQNRPQSPAFDVSSEASYVFGFNNAGPPEPTPRTQKRIGAEQGHKVPHTGTIHGNNTLKRSPAGSHQPTNPLQNPTTREASVHVARVAARDLVNNNLASRGGPGARQNPKSVAGFPDLFNVGGTGGRSANLVKIPVGTSPNKGKTVAALRSRNGSTASNDPTHAPLTAPSATPVHMGFVHVGYRQVK